MPASRREAVRPTVPACVHCCARLSGVRGCRLPSPRCDAPASPHAARDCGQWRTASPRIWSGLAVWAAPGKPAERLPAPHPVRPPANSEPVRPQAAPPREIGAPVHHRLPDCPALRSPPVPDHRQIGDGALPPCFWLLLRNRYIQTRKR